MNLSLRTMTDTTRDLIQRLARELDLYRQMVLDDCTSTHPLADEAHAYIAQPRPEGPPLEPRGCPTPGACSCPTSPTVPPELIRALELAEAALADIGDAEREPGDDLGWAEARAARDLPRIRIALDRWGRSTIQPEPEGPTDEELLKVAAATIDPYESRGIALDEYEAETECAVEAYGSELIAFARAVLARWGRPAVEPVPVSERLPGPEDCAPWPDEPDANHWCWLGKSIDGGWEWSQTSALDIAAVQLERVLAGGGWTHWLPHYALPIPQP